VALPRDQRRADDTPPTAEGGGATVARVLLARRIEDLRAPPANRLERPKGDRARRSALGAGAPSVSTVD
jgi:hypothetical protein